MARPAKATGTRARHDTKDEADIRKQCEDAMRGSGDKIKPGKHLTPPQKKIFKDIVRELEASNILGNLDVYILDKTAIAIDRMVHIEIEINNDPEKLYCDALMKAKTIYDRDFDRGCRELCLSPQSRAKISAAAAAKAKGPSALAVILGESG